jgi:hydrogenase maturation protease
MPNQIVVIGIGNPFRGDDGVGWIVIDKLKEKLNASVDLSKQQGDIVELLDAFSHYATVFLIDACHSKVFKNGWQRIDYNQDDLEIESHQTSTHGLNISQAIALAKNLNQLPQKLIIYAITGECYQVGQLLSPSSAKHAEDVAEAILNEEDIRVCMNKV